MPEKKKKKVSTAPWKNKHWTRDRFTVNKRKGFRVRFVSQDNVDEKKHIFYLFQKVGCVMSGYATANFK